MQTLTADSASNFVAEQRIPELFNKVSCPLAFKLDHVTFKVCVVGLSWSYMAMYHAICSNANVLFETHGPRHRSTSCVHHAVYILVGVCVHTCLHASTD